MTDLIALIRRHPVECALIALILGYAYAGGWASFVEVWPCVR